MAECWETERAWHDGESAQRRLLEAGLFTEMGATGTGCLLPWRNVEGGVPGFF